ncbi:MAG: hypothetical protein A2782_03070 [Candidatus Blackburnbacteria bacterium RIFCSPHIGHO2_01_FULL_43_15b]|uniref:Uncharacterized protein n=1 Tax=Candidatus Blackburnbacteria bacterium RIFCSPHIGHO2_01_FULL_43_15b TaxID=1797513 RepID=A0A1G1V2V6_9BACT|nr:MAG: hypothetical protein A2782_03070 [Candidatus Blackburnbacteria bacterium RIFCSPHIGHO2_01_FULL_43_15b]
MRTILAVIGVVALLAVALAQCGVPIPGTQPIVGPAPGRGVASPTAAPGAQPTAAPPAATPAPSTVYVDIPPVNAPAGPAPASEIGVAILDTVVYNFDGGARRWYGPWQTGKPQSPLMQGVPFQAKVKASCQTGGWRFFGDAVSLAMAGNNLFSSNPGIVEILCPFEEAEFVVTDGQLGFVPTEWVDWAWQDRVTGFEKASGRTSRGVRYRYDPGSRKLERIG